MLECSYCAKKFKYESEKKRHELSHIPQFECKECCKKFSFLSALKRHQKQHERTCSVVCSHCSRSFRDDTLLKRHLKYAHTGVNVCSKCSSTFNSDLALSSHMKSHKPKSERRFKCKYDGCNKSFNFTHHLKHHEQTHTNQKQHSCKICGKGFIQLHHLKTHYKSHISNQVLHNPVDVVTLRTTIDSGISSDSNCDNSEDSVKDSKLCTTCGQSIQLYYYEIHKRKCTLDEEKPKDLSLKLSSDELNNNNNAKVKPDLNYCDSVIGGCIAKGDSIDTDCLCAQIKIDVDFPDIEIECINPKNELIPIEALGDKVTNNSSRACDCSSKKTCNLSTNRRDYKNDLPQMEYRNDGVIKLKHAFDIDIIEINTTNNEKELKIKKHSDVFDSNNFVPYNSCQAVLGGCIASGNGTMSEECLCAKMSMDDQTIIAQEIDEITPRPNIFTA